MYDDCDCCSTPLTDEQKTKSYLNTRLSDASYTLLRKAKDVFHLNQDLAPKSPKELAARLAAGKFIVRDADVDKTDDYYGPIKNYIEWRDPATPANSDGYKAFELVLQTKSTATQDIIQVGTPADGLAALQAFESTTIQ